VRRLRGRRAFMVGEDLLLDTTYLLPILGIRMSLKGFSELFPKLLDDYTVFYNPVSLVEAKWVMLRLAKKELQKKGCAFRKVQNRPRSSIKG